MAISLWDETAAEPEVNQVLTSDARADVAIVGGGYTGLSTALHCAQAGLQAHVLEAHGIGHGGSGRNAGLVNAGVWYPPAEVRKKLGDRYGPRFVDLFGDAPRRVFELIEQHQIRCEVTRTGTIHVADKASGLAGLEARAAEWQRLGAPVELLSRDAVAERTGSKALFGGLLDHRAGTINPMGYCRGLARVARAAGAEISTQTQVTGLVRDGADWVVETDRGTVRARFVVLGTNAYTDEVWPGLSRVFTKMQYFQLATEPLGDDLRHILPDRQGIWSTGTIMFSLRRDMENRLVIGSMGEVMGALSRRWARRMLGRLFPDLGPVTFEDAWHGQFAMTPDHLPRICRLAENLYTPIGYNGRGITTGTVFGAAMADLIGGMDPGDLPLPITEVETVRSAPVMERFYRVALAAHQVIKSI